MVSFNKSHRIVLNFCRNGFVHCNVFVGRYWSWECFNRNSMFLEGNFYSRPNSRHEYSDYTETHKKIQMVAYSTKEVQIEELSKKEYQGCEKIV